MSKTSRKPLTRRQRFAIRRAVILGSLVLLTAAICLAISILSKPTTPATPREDQLIEYAREIYQKELQSKSTHYFTVNLGYMGRSGYDVSDFAGCDEARTYAVIKTDTSHTILTITPTLSCD